MIPEDAAERLDRREPLRHGLRRRTSRIPPPTRPRTSPSSTPSPPTCPPTTRTRPRPWTTGPRPRSTPIRWTTGPRLRWTTIPPTLTSCRTPRCRTPYAATCRRSVRSARLRRDARAGRRRSRYVAAVLPILEEFLGEVRRSIDYFRSRGGDVEAIYLTGGGAKLKGLGRLPGPIARNRRVTLTTPCVVLTATCGRSRPTFVDEHRNEFAIAIGNGLLHLLRLRRGMKLNLLPHHRKEVAARQDRGRRGRADRPRVRSSAVRGPRRLSLPAA